MKKGNRIRVLQNFPPENLREELAWAAGFFDGEGTVHFSNVEQPVCALSQIDRFVLDRFHRVVRVGNVTGPYAQNVYGPRTMNAKPQYRWSAGSYEGVQAVCALLWAFLSPVKRDQFARVLREAQSA